MLKIRPSFSIYDASAGSGKTYALVREYLQIILTSSKPDAYRNILAITFTNKAVHEMKSRIVGNLSEFAKPDPNPKALQLMQTLAQDTGMSVAAIKEKAREIIIHLIHNYAAFDISTIDKFTHRVIRAFAHDLNLPLSFEVTLDTDNLLSEAVDTIIARAGEDQELTKLLVDFTMEKTDDDKSWDVSREILETGKMALSENHRSEIERFKDKTIPEFVAIKTRLQEAALEIEAQNREMAQQAISLLEKSGIDHKSFSAGNFPKHLTGIASGHYNLVNKHYYEPEDIKINKSATDRTLIEALIPELLLSLDSIYRNFARRDFYRAFLKNITPLSLLQTVSHQVAEIQREQNVLSISEFNAIIYRELQNQPAPFIYERMGEKYRHFFIDEFQDTSEMQWQNLIPLIDNALSGQDELGQKGTLMIVGDPKQSIYRWRGGKAEQFITLGKEGDNFNPFNNKQKEKFSLDMNRRSYAEVVAFNNAFFKLLSHKFEQPDYKDLYLNHSEQLVNEKCGGYVSLQFLPAASDDPFDSDLDKADQYTRATLETIRLAQSRGFEYKDIVVLVRHNKNGVLLANFLSAQNIPLQSSETLLLAYSIEVRMIVDLLRYLKNADDLEAKAHFLYYIATKLQTNLPVPDYIAIGMDLVEENELEKWLVKTALFHGPINFRELRKKSLYETVESIIAAVFSTAESNAYVQYFLDIILDRDLRNQAGIADFLDYWDKKSESFSIPSPEGSNAVRIISIHKSKGLEFPVVILPFAEENYSMQRRDRIWVEAEHPDFGLERVLIANNSQVANFGDAAQATYQQRRQEELLDNINVLYVALTRAEEQLYVISQMQTTNKAGNYPDNAATFFISFLQSKGLFDETKNQYEFGSPARISEAGPHVQSSTAIPIVSHLLEPSAIKIATRESQMWGSVQQDAIAYGNSVHDILSRIKTAADVATAIELAVAEGLITNAQKSTVTRSIKSIMDAPALQLFFDPDSLILNEQPIIGFASHTLKPDRMVIRPDHKVLLLDYKTGAPHPKYTLQLESYAQAIAAMGYQVSQKTLVYIGESVNIVNL